MPTRRALPAVAVVLVVLVALLGAVALGLGVAMRTAWLPADEVTSTADLSDDNPGLVVVTAPGLLEMRPGPVTVTATSADGGPVLIARGREQDVTGWVADAPHLVLDGLTSPTAVSSSAVVVEGAPDEPAPLPAPADADLWVQVEQADGEASLVWDDPPGRWSLLLAGDGTTPAPETVSFTWPAEVSTPWATPLRVAGAVLLALALAGATLLVVRHRRRRPEESA